MLRDGFFLGLRIGVEFEGTVEDSSVVESGNDECVVGFIFRGLSIFGGTSSH